MAFFSRFCPVMPDVGDDQVAAVAAYLVDGQLGGGLDQSGERSVLEQKPKQEFEKALKNPTEFWVEKAKAIDWFKATNQNFG